MVSEMIGTVLVTVLVVAIVAGACIIDVTHNPCNHPRKLVVRRFLNWFLVGITYASTYFGRYNINVANNSQTYDLLGITSKEFGYIVTCSSASYAVFVVINGFVVDLIGGKKSMVIGALGSSVFNAVMGVIATMCTKGTLHGNKAVYIICGVYICNNFFQTFCTTAIVKVAANWYHFRERGYFSSVFGVVIALGFYFAYQVNGVLYGNFDWCWIFFIPAIQLFVLGILNIPFAHNTPHDAGFTYNPLTLKDSASDEGEDNENKPLIEEEEKKPEVEKPKLSYLLKTVFCNPIFIILSLVDICLGWNRDGVLAWYPEILNSRFNAPTTSNQYALASGGTTIGGMFGSLSAGIISDSLFHSRRPPVACIFFTLLFINMFALMFVDNGYVFAILVTIASIWYNGLNGLITSTCAMDFAGTAATGTAVGLLDGIQKIGSALCGIQGNILSASGGEITKENYVSWVFYFLPTGAFAIGLLLTVLNRKSAEAEKTEEKKEEEH